MTKIIARKHYNVRYEYVPDPNSDYWFRKRFEADGVDREGIQLIDGETLLIRILNLKKNGFTFEFQDD